MKVLVTRPRVQANSFAADLKAAGFEPILFPVIEIRPADDSVALDRAIGRLDCYDWVVFTSVNGVDAFCERMTSLGLGSAFISKEPIDVSGQEKEGSGVKVAAIGPKTAEALRLCGIEPDYIPAEYVAEAILPGLGDLRGCWVLLPRADIARKALPNAISRAGGVAHEVVAYRTVPAAVSQSELDALEAGIDVVTFTSPSTVQGFVEVSRRAGIDPLNLAGNPKIACIGPITQKAAEDEGFLSVAVAQEYTTQGLLSILKEWDREV